MSVPAVTCSNDDEHGCGPADFDGESDRELSAPAGFADEELLAEEGAPEGGVPGREAPAEGAFDADELGVDWLPDAVEPGGGAGCCQFALPASPEDRSCSVEPVSSAPTPQISNTITTTVPAMATARLRQYTDGGSCPGGSVMWGR